MGVQKGKSNKEVAGFFKEKPVRRINVPDENSVGTKVRGKRVRNPDEGFQDATAAVSAVLHGYCKTHSNF